MGGWEARSPAGSATSKSLRLGVTPTPPGCVPRSLFWKLKSQPSSGGSTFSSGDCDGERAPGALGEGASEPCAGVLVRDSEPIAITGRIKLLDLDAGGWELGGGRDGGGASSTPKADAKAAARSSGRGSGAFLGRVGMRGGSEALPACLRFKIKCSSALDTNGANEITCPTASSCTSW